MFGVRNWSSRHVRFGVPGISMEVLADRTWLQVSLTQICGPNFKRFKHKSLWEEGNRQGTYMSKVDLDPG